MKDSQEIWLPILGWEGLYEVSNFGRVKSVARVICRKPGILQPVSERILRSEISGPGYPAVSLSGNDGRQVKKVHALVLEAFCGPRPKGMQCRHLDGVPTHCWLSNLCWGTPKENAADRTKHGTENFGTRQGSAKLTEDDVVMIRKRAVSRDSINGYVAIAKELGVSRGAVRAAAIGDTWRCVLENKK